MLFFSHGALPGGNLSLVSFHRQDVRVLRHQQPAPAVPVGLGSAQPDHSERAAVFPPQPQAVHVRDPQDVGQDGHHCEAEGGRFP